METGAHRGHPGNGSPVASGGLAKVWEANFQTQEADRARTDLEGSAPVDLPNYRRESDLGAPRIHGELLMVSFDLSERTIYRGIKRAPKTNNI